MFCSIKIAVSPAQRTHVCVIFRGLIQMTDADEGYRQEEQGTHLDKILLNNSTKQMELALFQLFKDQSTCDGRTQLDTGWYPLYLISVDHFRTMVLYQVFC